MREPTPLASAAPAAEGDPAAGRSVICEVFVFAFALWTIAVHLTVLTRGNLYDLLACAALLALLALVLARSWRRGRPVEAASASARRVAGRNRQEAAFWLLTAVVVGLTLTAHRPDADDALYVNLAVSAADAPAGEINQYDRQHSVAREVPIRRSSRLVALGMAAAAASWLTGIPAIHVFHLVLPPLAAVLVLLANRELFRILAPKHWALGVLAVVVVLCADGEIHRSYGNFSFVRLHQGKAVLLSAGVPLLIAYGLRFARRSTGRSWLLLGAAQVAAMGLSSTGMLVAPVVATLAVVAGGLGSGLVTQLGLLRRSLLASAYVVVLGLWAKWPLLVFAAFGGGGKIAAPAMDLGRHVDSVFGGGRFEVFQLFALLTAWVWCERRIARRLCLVFPILVALLFFNHLSAAVIGPYLMPAKLYWRTFWLLPLPAMAALTLLAPLALRRWPFGPRARYGLFVLLLLLVPGLLSERLIFSPDNGPTPEDGVRMRLPGLKVPAEHAVARRIAELVEGRPTVLVPQRVSTWIPTLHHHPYPLVSRLGYATRSRFREDLEIRTALKRYVTDLGRRPDPGLQRGLERYRIACVAFLGSHRRRQEIRSVLVASGFWRAEIVAGHEIWLRGARP